ncbi:MAG: phosphatase PAP2 family protein [Bdellovibrionales bacterium]|nr:phosphatase PAP2 family protein [Bdellovibrionales bacterium]
MNLSALLLGSLSIVITVGASANPFKSVILFQPPVSIPALLEAPPAPGSREDQADFKELHYWQKNRTQAQCAAANKEVNLFLRTFVGSRTDLLAPMEELKLTKEISKLQLKLVTIVTQLKNRFGRPRPYLVDKTLSPCLPAENTSSAYPSGHAASAYAIAEALSHVFPRRSDAFMQRAQEIAFNRMLGGVHHRTDLIAGEKVGRYYGRRTRALTN